MEPTLIYCLMRCRVEQCRNFLLRAGIKVGRYYSAAKDKKDGMVLIEGMPPPTREENNRTQTAFMADELEVVVATTAFGALWPPSPPLPGGCEQEGCTACLLSGMGIDKPNVRCVLIGFCKTLNF
jgi:superfamily II DNA helicase RecQ